MTRKGQKWAPVSSNIAKSKQQETWCWSGFALAGVLTRYFREPIVLVYLFNYYFFRFIVYPIWWTATGPHHSWLQYRKVGYLQQGAVKTQLHCAGTQQQQHTHKKNNTVQTKCSKSRRLHHEGVVFGVIQEAEHAKRFNSAG